MSFFIRGKNKVNVNNKRTKNKTFEHNKKKKKIEETKDEEITSSEDEGITLETEKQFSDSEDENETAQDKKLRLAKIYLQELERLEKEKLCNEDEVDKSLISKRLKDDYLKETGKFKSFIADQYSDDKLEGFDVIKCREQTGTVTCICVSSDNKYLFSGSKDGIIVKWNIETKRKEGVLPFVKHQTPENVTGHNSKIMSIAISTDDLYLAIGEESSNIQIWNPSTLKHIKTFKGHSKSITGVGFKKNSHILYSCSADRSVKVWNLGEMMYVETLFGHQDNITSLDALYKDRVITSGSRDGTLRIWKITEESQLVYNGHSGSIDIVKLINEECFISGGEDGQICLWSCMKKKPVFVIKDAHGIDPTNGQANWICSIATLTNTDLFATGSCNGFVKLWKLGENFRSAQFLFEIPVVGFINSLVFTLDGTKLIASCGRDHRLGRWRTIKEVKNNIKIFSLKRK
ncbi:hypothetical protein WA026_001482 [Henosepilachna vigintioctopunctata]|uniref:U3 small nucleolar RNA-interacting protein 2 n=1 Tax=Henosepilachna vigintioctopunctata TaxID=420089 RepID=A0AAW1UI96_9CUCU